MQLNIGLSQYPSLWRLGSCNNCWTTGRSDCINCLVFFRSPIWLYQFWATIFEIVQIADLVLSISAYLQSDSRYDYITVFI